MTRRYSDKDDPFGSSQHVINFGRTNEDGAFVSTGSSVALPGNIDSFYVGRGGNDGWLISNVDLWKGMPDLLSGHKGYNYDAADLKMRYRILNDPSIYHGYKSAIRNWEARGWAEPLTKNNYWDTYGHTLGTLRAAEVYVSSAAGLAGGAQGGYWGTPRRFSYIPSSSSSSNVRIVTPDGVVLPKGATIPKNYVPNPNRAGSYGVYRGGKFTERLRIDAGTPKGMKGPNESHIHINGGGHI